MNKVPSTVFDEADSAADTLVETFGDYAITASADELEQELEEECFFLDPLALQGQMTMIYAPPNAGKTLLILNLTRDFVCRFITLTPTTASGE